MKLFQREPTLYLSVAYGLITLAGTLGLRLFTGENAALAVAALAAIVGAINAYAVRPISPVAFTYAFGAILALVGSYGYHLPDETVAAASALIVPILALLSRGQVSPEETAVSKA